MGRKEGPSFLFIQTNPCDEKTDLEIRGVGETGAPRIRHADEHAVGGVELAVL
jgi:hypothetical protein